jgi:hypothetical protein
MSNSAKTFPRSICMTILGLTRLLVYCGGNPCGLYVPFHDSVVALVLFEQEIPVRDAARGACGGDPASRRPSERTPTTSREEDDMLFGTRRHASSLPFGQSPGFMRCRPRASGITPACLGSKQASRCCRFRNRSRTRPPRLCTFGGSISQDGNEPEGKARLDENQAIRIP